METIKLDISHVFDFVPETTIWGYREKAMVVLETIHNQTGMGSDFLGWVDLPERMDKQEIEKIKSVSDKIRAKIDTLVVVGIGGSYLGAKFVVEALAHHFSAMLTDGNRPMILFAGQNIGEDYHADLLDILDERSYGVVVISKSGTTTEPAVAFRILKNHLENKVGKAEAAERIIAITDSNRGALRQMADDEGYDSFVIPDDVGGRYSVLSPVGLVPISIAGYDIDAMIRGARQMAQQTDVKSPFEKNPAAQYAVTRFALYNQGKTIEILVDYHPKLHFLAEWWKQLYGESEGKQLKGIYPSSVSFTTDLHSMGQYIQEGLRNIFETVISIREPYRNLSIPMDPKDHDKLNYLSGRRIDEVNKMAELGTLLAHLDGGIPIIHIDVPKLTEYYIGQLIYFFEKACAISGYLLDINPFDQPGVEAYKRNMFALLGKKGFEAEGQVLRNRLAKNK
jgi:glucose-6-phosphate isomerase